MRGWLVYQPGFSLDKQGVSTPISCVYSTRRVARDAAKSLSLTRMVPHRVVQVWVSPYKYKLYQWLIYNDKKPLTQQVTPRIYATKKLALQMAEHFDKVYVGKHKVVKVRVYQ